MNQQEDLSKLSESDKAKIRHKLRVVISIIKEIQSDLKKAQASEK